MSKTRKDDEERTRLIAKPFREKLDILVGKIIAEGKTARRLRDNPRDTLRKLGFSEPEIETLGDISFDIFLKKRDKNMLKPSPIPPLPCAPDDPTKTLVIVFKSGETVTGGKFFIDLDELTSSDK